MVPYGVYCLHYVLHLEVSTPEGLELHLDLYGQQEQVLFLEVPRQQEN